MTEKTALLRMLNWAANHSHDIGAADTARAIEEAILILERDLRETVKKV